MKSQLLILVTFLYVDISAQLKWQNVDSLYQPLPSSVHVYRTTDSLDGKPNIAYYIEADLKDKRLVFDTDTTYKRRITPQQYFERNQKPLVVVNTTFFSFATNQNLNVVIDEGKLVGYNVHSVPGRGKDTFTYRHTLGSAIGISKKREADIAWLYTDTSLLSAYGLQFPFTPIKDSNQHFTYDFVRTSTDIMKKRYLEKWKMQTAVGGGPVLLQEGRIKISNNEELKFAGKAIDDKHPRTAMGYTNAHKLIILVIEGRNPGKAEGASLTQEAQIFKDLGCVEALNLDGGGSSCMLINGKPTIKVSDIGGQRPIPAVFIIKTK
jgi:hypothetical protein